MSFLDDVITYIQTAGLATFNINMFAGSYPSTAPDRCILVKASGGWAPSLYVPIRHPTIQVLSRSFYSPEAEAKLREVYNLFHGESAKHNYEIGDYYVLVSQAMQEPGDIGPDAQGRAEWSVNFVFKIMPAPATVKEPEEEE